VRKSPRLVGCLLLGLLSSGCGSNMLKIKGRIVKDGQAYVTAPDEGLRILFVPTVPPLPDRYDSYVAMYNRRDGSFQVVGKDGNGLPPGTYKVALELIKKKKDAFRGAYSAPKSPFLVEVNRGTGEVMIDLDKKGGAG
jgi:hypothetical protein